MGASLNSCIKSKSGLMKTRTGCSSSFARVKTFTSWWKRWTRAWNSIRRFWGSRIQNTRRVSSGPIWSSTQKSSWTSWQSERDSKISVGWSKWQTRNTRSCSGNKWSRRRSSTTSDSLTTSTTTQTTSQSCVRCWKKTRKSCSTVILLKTTQQNPRRNREMSQ